MTNSIKPIPRRVCPSGRFVPFSRQKGPCEAAFTALQGKSSRVPSEYLDEERRHNQFYKKNLTILLQLGTRLAINFMEYCTDKESGTLT